MGVLKRMNLLGGGHKPVEPYHEKASPWSHNVCICGIHGDANAAMKVLDHGLVFHKREGESAKYGALLELQLTRFDGGVKQQVIQMCVQLEADFATVREHNSAAESEFYRKTGIRANPYASTIDPM